MVELLAFLILLPLFVAVFVLFLKHALPPILVVCGVMAMFFFMPFWAAMTIVLLGLIAVQWAQERKSVGRK